jgi:hypothetical protein
LQSMQYLQSLQSMQSMQLLQFQHPMQLTKFRVLIVKLFSSNHS